MKTEPMFGVCDRFGRDDAQGKEMGKLGMGGRMLWEPRILWAGTDRDGGAKERAHDNCLVKRVGAARRRSGVAVVRRAEWSGGRCGLDRDSRGLDAGAAEQDTGWKLG